MAKQRQNLIAGISVAGIIVAIGALIGFSNPDPQTASSQTASKLSTSTSTPTEPKIKTKTETSTHTIPYETIYIDSNTLEKGKTEVATTGVEGVKTITYEITYTNDIETNRKILKTETTQSPVSEVIIQGAYVPPKIITNPTPSQNCNIKGNISYRTGEKIYHVPGQQYYNSTEIDTSAGERWFCSEAEAQAAGWRKSKR